MDTVQQKSPAEDVFPKTPEHA